MNDPAEAEAEESDSSGPVDVSRDNDKGVGRRTVNDTGTGSDLSDPAGFGLPVVVVRESIILYYRVRVEKVMMIPKKR